MASAVAPPQTLPADFNGWDKTPPKVLPADFSGWDKPAVPDRPAGVPAGVTLGQPSAHPAVTMRGGAGNLDTIPASESQPGALGAIQTGVHNFGARVANNGLGLLRPVLHPRDTGNDILKRGFAITPDAIKAGSYNPSGPDAGATTANVLGDAATALLTHRAGTVAAEAPGALKGTIRGPINEPMVGTNLTPATRYASAQRLGVNLDAADATNSPLFKMAKSVNENSLLGGGSYEKLRAANTSALQGSTDDFLNKMYPGEREEGGLAIQKALKQNQSTLQSKATAGFDSLPQNIPIPGLEEVGKTAQDMAAQNSAYQDLFPSLTPKKTMGVVGDVGGLGPQPPAPIRMSPFVDERGQPMPSSAQAPPQQPHSFSTAQKLRSDLLDFRRNNPDIVANQGDAMIGNLAGKTDEAITGASSLLNPTQLKAFRDANAAWGDMKQTYDDPSSPLYHAVRTNNPSTLYGGVGSKTPEMARNLQDRLGSGIQPLRRGTVEGALKTNADGSPNFKTFGTQLNRIPADYRAELFSPDQNATLRDISNTSNVLKMDANPSGSGKLGQKVLEGGMLLHPNTAAAPLLQYPLAKLMTSPAMVQRLMAPPVAPNPFFAPAVSGASLLATPRKRERN